MLHYNKKYNFIIRKSLFSLSLHHLCRQRKEIHKNVFTILLPNKKKETTHLRVYITSTQRTRVEPWHVHTDFESSTVSVLNEVSPSANIQVSFFTQWF